MNDNYDDYNGAPRSMGSAEEMTAELHKHMEHVFSHNPSDLKFAIVLAGHKDKEGEGHICSMAAGSPELIVTGIMSLVEELIKKDKVFAIAFLMAVLQKTKATRESLSEKHLDSTGGASAEAAMKALLSKFGGGAF